MRRSLTRTVAALAALALLAGAGSALASSSDPQGPPPATAAEQTGADTDNVQVGDQTTPDTAPEQGEENGSESESEAAENDGPGGHADEPGSANADHQFQGEE